MKKLFIKTLTLSLIAMLLALPSFALDGNNQQKLEEIINLIHSDYYQDVSDEALMEAIYNGVTKALDPHSVYFDKETLQSFQESIAGSFVGIGVSIMPNGDYIEVVTPIDGSPAKAAGIQAGDLIVAVDGIDIAGMSIEEVVGLIKGQAGQAVTLRIRRAGVAADFDVTIIRAEITVQSVNMQMVEDIAVIRISSFDSHTAQQLNQFIAQLDDDQAMVIDLRNNPGGLLDQVVVACDLFLEDGKNITTIDYTHYRDAVYDATKGAYQGKMVVLINSASASASEIFAGAMKDNNRATIMGTTSFGKGTVQTITNLSDGSALKLTIGRYATPSGVYIDGIGVEPTITVEASGAFDPTIKGFYPMQSLNSSRYGSKDIDTYGLEQRLDYLGYTVVVDGYFDQDTVTALKDLQTKLELTADGALNLETKIAVEKTVQLLAMTRVEDVQLQAAIKHLKK